MGYSLTGWWAAACGMRRDVSQVSEHNGHGTRRGYRLFVVGDSWPEHLRRLSRLTLIASRRPTLPSIIPASRKRSWDQLSSPTLRCMWEEIGDTHTHTHTELTHTHTFTHVLTDSHICWSEIMSCWTWSVCVYRVCLWGKDTHTLSSLDHVTV